MDWAQASRRLVMGTLSLKRAYVPPDPNDGIRLLIDRLWPRGVSRSEAAIDCWMKEIAPSVPLRKWFGHDPARFAEFSERYREELDENPEAVAQLCDMVRFWATRRDAGLCCSGPPHQSCSRLGGIPG